MDAHFRREATSYRETQLRSEADSERLAKLARKTHPTVRATDCDARLRSATFGEILGELAARAMGRRSQCPDAR